MTITLCNSHPFTFYLPFHTSLRADQCPIQSHVPSTCTLGLDPCARHSLFGRTDPYYIDNFYSSCGLKRLAATLASPFSVIVLSSQYLFQRGPIWMSNRANDLQSGDREKSLRSDQRPGALPPMRPPCQTRDINQSDPLPKAIAMYFIETLKLYSNANTMQRSFLARL